MIPIQFLVVDARTSNNILLGRPSLNQLSAIVLTSHLVMKFPFTYGYIITFHVNHKTILEYYITSL